jgi:RimJ/RimL family protein N-acetyltransferase
MALVDHWPFFGLRVRTPRLELRYPDDELCAAIVEVAAGGIHNADAMPFLNPWTRAPADELPRESMRFFWRTRAELTADDWHLALAVLVDGEPVGVPGLVAQDIGVRRGVETGSWLGQAHQGRGVGTEMRRAVLHLAFAGLGAHFAETQAFDDNPASLGVTNKLGYEPNGDLVHVREGAAATLLRFTMTRRSWEEHLAADDVTIDGLDACLPLLGAAAPA